MRIHLFLIILSAITSKAYAQYFKVLEYKPNSSNLFFANDSLTSYKILPLIDSSNANRIGYPLKFEGRNMSDKDTLAMIGELLKFEGDKRVCYLRISNYNLLSSQLYMGGLTKYSLQVEALFLINQLYFEKPFNYSPYPLLFDKIHNTYASINEVSVYSAYKAYKIWYEKIKKLGLKRAKKENIDPLKDTWIRWYR